MVASLSILLVSEDRAKDAIDTFRSIVKHMLRIISPSFEVQSNIFEPLADPDSMYISRGHLWKSTKREDRAKQIDFMRELANKLAEGNSSFVFYHLDGDRPWSESKSGLLCEHVGPFRDFIKKNIPILPARQSPNNSIEKLISAFDARLVLIVPYYSIEAWLYQNFSTARKLCLLHHRGEHLQQIADLQSSPASLDDIVKPKESLCLKSKHNRQLAEDSFPAFLTYELKTSFAAAVDVLLDCSELMAALEAYVSTMRYQTPSVRR